jgi:hypothetical protein
MSQGKGISDAVRKIAPQWFDPETTEAAREAAKLNGVEAYELNVGKNWTRKREGGRRRNRSGEGWIRKYYCKGVREGRVELEIQCNEDESAIKFFTIRAGGKVISGGVSNVASMFHSQRNNKARVGEDIAVAKKEEFRRMTLAEIRRIDTLVDFDSIADTFEEREA